MRKYWLFLIFVFLLSGVSANYIYGDIYIENDGIAVFSVNTDVELDFDGLSFDGERLDGETNELISLEKGVWSFILDLGYYETILLDIHLPDNIDQINSIESVEYLMGFRQKTISLIDQDKDLYVDMDYELNSSPNNTFFYFILIILLLVVLFYAFVQLSKKKKKKLEGIFPLINGKEKNIIEFLMKEPMKQNELRKVLNIPKASYSRYIVNLEKKKLIIREGEGKNKILKLK